MKTMAETVTPTRIERSQLRGFFNPMAATLSPRNRNQNPMNTNKTHFTSVETMMSTRKSLENVIAFVAASSAK
jgi:hypothetical protein